MWAEMDEFKGLALYLGGKSMGARLAAQIVAQDVGASGLVLPGLIPPPPGETSELRDQPLYQLPCPPLFIEGARDPFCRMDLLPHRASVAARRARVPPDAGARAPRSASR